MITVSNIALSDEIRKSLFQEESAELKDHLPEALAKGIPAYRVGRTWRIAKEGYYVVEAVRERKEGINS